MLPEQAQLLESYVQLDLLLPLLEACNSSSTTSAIASTRGPGFETCANSNNKYSIPSQACHA